MFERSFQRVRTAHKGDMFMRRLRFAKDKGGKRIGKDLSELAVCDWDMVQQSAKQIGIDLRRACSSSA